MKLRVPKKFGKRLYDFEVEGDNLFEALMEAEKLSFPSVPKCGVCQSDSLRLRAYLTEKGGYEYIKLECGECRASVTFGKRKDEKDVFFLRKTESGELDWQEFKSNGSNKPKSEPQKRVVMSQEEADELNIPDVPF